MEELQELFKRVNELTGKYPKLNETEIRELRLLASNLWKESSDFLYDMEYFADDKE